MPELYMKHAGTWVKCEAWGATLNSNQEPNNWKTPTGFQCGLPGQHEQELSTMTAKLQDRGRRRAQNNREHWRQRILPSTGTNWKNNEHKLGIF